VLLARYKVTSPHTIHPDASLSRLTEFAERMGVSFAPRIQRLFVDRMAEATG